MKYLKPLYQLTELRLFSRHAKAQLIHFPLRPSLSLSQNHLNLSLRPSVSSVPRPSFLCFQPQHFYHTTSAIASGSTNDANGSVSHGSGSKSKHAGDQDAFHDWLSRIVFQDGHLVAINKPLGWTVYGQMSEGERTGASSNQSLNESLPRISQHLSLIELNIGLSLKSYYSGVVVLSKSNDSAKKLKKCLSSSAAQKHCYQKFLAITVGKPQCEVNEQKEICLNREYIHNRKMALVSDSSIHVARKEGRMIQTIFRLKTISYNKETESSLVQIEINKDKWDAVQVLLSHYLSPVLGDRVYSSRTCYILGVPVACNPHAAIPDHQTLPESLQTALQRKFELSRRPLPLFLHRHKISLPNFPSRSSPPVEITAPVSTEFRMALDCLGLCMEGS